MLLYEHPAAASSPWYPAAAILAAGTTDSLDYSKAKGAFIELHSR